MNYRHRLFAALLISVAVLRVSSQEGHKCYWPDGTRFITRDSTVRSYLDSVGIKYYHHFEYKNAILFYYPLSQKLAFAWAQSPTELNEAKSAYKHSSYLESYDFQIDLKEIFDKGTLDTNYIIETFGRPDQRTGEGYGDTRFWIYRKYNIDLTISGHLAVSHKYIDYKKIAQMELDVSKYQLALSDYSVSGSDYSAGFSISVTNYSKKTIKYIWFTVRATNPVDDLVGVKTTRGIGPIESMESGSYDFESIFYSRVIDRITLTGIKIEYMDKSTRSLSAEQIKKIWAE